MLTMISKMLNDKGNTIHRTRTDFSVDSPESGRRILGQTQLVLKVYTVFR